MATERPHVSDDEAGYRAGTRLGLPAGGRNAVAGWGRRILALVIDWFAGLLVIAAFAGGTAWNGGGAAMTFLPLGMFFVQATLLTALAGGSFGQLITRIGVLRLPDRRIGIASAALRTLLICLVVPPLVFDKDGRGLHDLATDTVVVRR